MDACQYLYGFKCPSLGPITCAKTPNNAFQLQVATIDYLYSGVVTIQAILKSELLTRLLHLKNAQS